LATVRAHLGTLRDDLARALCWSASWEAVRDAALPAREFVPLALDNVEGERDIGVLEQLLAQTQGAILVYGDPARRGAALATLAAHALAALGKAEPGSDRQLAWARTFIAAARSAEHLAVVRGLLDASATFEGLTVDTDLRWRCVRALAASGAAGDDIIDAELQRDQTDQGRRQAAGARAARPTAQAKAAAWRAITEDTSLPLATLRAIMGGFQRRDQEALLRPYVDRYFERLAPVWRERSFEVAQTFSEGLYPDAGDEETVRQTDAYLAREDVPPPLRRILLEGKDDLERALRARAKDAAAEPPPV
jgi:aminopeptidase N